MKAHMVDLLEIASQLEYNTAAELMADVMEDQSTLN